MADRAHPPGTLTYDPAADVAERYPGWVVATVDLGGLVPEVLCWTRRIILIEREQSAHARRSSLAHAVAHLDLGHARTLNGHFERREEAQADRLAADRLIPLEDFAAALAWSQNRRVVADQLGVDLEMLAVREDGLSRSERTRLRRRVARVRR
ncbi:hypothetical protein ABIE44_002374 [Marmoricola sp. OAE513]|uniref:ImmA/IrrE family metallo-endopeptidase n=1 Tax=Marmoricola sp. OAE513 TaxID=2817894 RepID=UPI001AEAAC61